MKQSICCMMLLFLLSTPSLLHADTLSLTTYYPAPFGSYSILKLNPSTDASMGACDASKTGQMYFSSDSGEIKVCSGTSWGSTGPWMLNVPSKYVYQQHSTTDTAYKVGIGIAAPTARLHVKGINDANYGQLRVESTQSDAKFTLYNSSGATTTGNGSILMSNTAGSEGMRFMINNTDEMILDENGNVGIGVLAPSVNLHVVGPDNGFDGQLKVESTSHNAQISLYNASGATNTGRATIRMSDGAGFEGLRFIINNSDKMIIDENGNVGIGDIAPNQFLSIKKDQAGVATIARVTNGSANANTQAVFQLVTGTANSYANHDVVELGGGSSYYELDTGDGVTGGMFFVSGSTATNIPIIFRQGGTERMRIHSTGNVGIGATPSYKLHVNGPIGGALQNGSANVGELKVNCTTSPGNCYAVYAP